MYVTNHNTLFSVLGFVIPMQTCFGMRKKKRQKNKTKKQHKYLKNDLMVFNFFFFLQVLKKRFCFSSCSLPVWPQGNGGGQHPVRRGQWRLLLQASCHRTKLWSMSGKALKIVLTKVTGLQLAFCSLITERAEWKSHPIDSEFCTISYSLLLFTSFLQACFHCPSCPTHPGIVWAGMWAPAWTLCLNLVEAF